MWLPGRLYQLSVVGVLVVRDTVTFNKNDIMSVSKCPLFKLMLMGQMTY